MDMLKDVIVFLVAAITAVPLFKKLGLGAVLGYLAAGVAIGPWGLGLITGVAEILHFAELGVVLLLFIIGLELQPSRLWLLRKPMLALGGAQFLVTTALIFAAAAALGVDWRAALVLGMCLSLSSTAFGVQLLAEKNQFFSLHGRTAFSVLLFQDLVVILILAVLPLLSADHGVAHGQSGLLQTAKSAGMIAAVIVGGHYLVRPLLRLVAWAHNPELFSAASLLVALGTAGLMTMAGLSMALGAFLAGVLLADSEFRHELEAGIEPFKGLLLGLFFISVGMSMDLGIFAARPLAVAGLAGALLAGKAAILFVLARMYGLPGRSALSLAALISQGGEFAFIILHEAGTLALVDAPLGSTVVLAVTVSMALTPLLYGLAEAARRQWPGDTAARPYDDIHDDEPRVIIVGFGRFGQIIARILAIKRIRFTALESNVEQVDFVRRFGNKVYFGDATRLDVLRAAGLDKAEVLILSIVNQEVSVKVAAAAKKHFPRVKVFARARNREHAYRLMDIGVDYVIRETFLSAVELARHVLRDVGTEAEEADKITAAFTEYDQQLLQQQHAIHHDEAQIIASTHRAALELQSLFEEDKGAGIEYPEAGEEEAGNGTDEGKPPG